MTASDSYALVHGDAVETMSTFADASIDALITDPPYPEVERDYGKLTEAQWFDLMQGVIFQAHRIIKPHGSCVFVLQPNAERLGRMRPWLWQFMAYVCDLPFSLRWGMVQDVWWWNYGAMPLAGTRREVGLLRGSLKACVWVGPEDCYRDQDAVLWEPSDSVKALTRERRAFKVYDAPDGKRIDKNKIMAASVERGGVSPFNVIPLANTDSRTSGGALGHTAATPAKLAAWWIRYLTRPGDVVLDPFSGSGTITAEAVRLGRRAIGIEKMAKYHRIAVERMSGE